MSRSTRAAWIETRTFSKLKTTHERRGPHGPRGLKPARMPKTIMIFGSRSTRAAWIETRITSTSDTLRPCRGPHGPRGLKRNGPFGRCLDECRGPHGPRGLKLQSIRRVCPVVGRGPHGPRGLKQSNRFDVKAAGFRSRSTRAAWIETLLGFLSLQLSFVAVHTGRVD